jgi:3-deoxy-manno-octulosonate cytidylyltransferase (CMP-KDO synthetase)
MIAWVVAAARAAGSVDQVAVVTDHAGIARAAEDAGARALLDSTPATSGSDRIARLLALDPDAGRAEIVVNLQGDEPLIEPAAIDLAIAALDDAPTADIATLARLLRRGEEPGDPALVKVALAADGRALWFSRAPIPHGAAELVHVGLYAYRRAAFDRFIAAPPTALERAERLEQLRALEIGLTIMCARCDSSAVAVDRPEDLERVEAALAARERSID